ncbi:MAG: hypothetical protein FJ270_06890 [Planctomycetes bacterium]|nr:hypothetical protein [Planctomycetota bacterium]
MRCRSCQHELWNVRPGPCPECGEPFNPRTAIFERYSAHFCCPHCGEAYWGNGKDGLPDPPEFACARCSGIVRLEEMVLRPAPGQEGREIRQDLHPFEGSPKGLLRRTWDTLSMATSDPVRLGRALPPRPDLAQAGLFAGLIAGVGVGAALAPAVVTTAYNLITVGSIDVLSMRSSDLQLVVGAAMGAAVIGSIVYLGLIALIIAIILRVMNPRAFDARRIVACWCYASGVTVLGALPCIGACATPLILILGPRILLAQLEGAGLMTPRMAKVIYTVCIALTLAALALLFLSLFVQR